MKAAGAGRTGGRGFAAKEDHTGIASSSSAEMIVPWW
jgi:hypothetical protein